MGTFDRLVGAGESDEDISDLMPPATDPKTYASPSGIYTKLYSRGKLPPTSHDESAKRIKVAIVVSALERTQLDDSRIEKAFGASKESREAFWKINQGFRILEAWGGPEMFGKIVPEPKSAYTAWKDVSEKWKRNIFKSVEQLEQLSSMSNSLMLCQNYAQQYGFPEAYHSDRRDIAEGAKAGDVINRYGGEHKVDVPDLVNLTGFLGFADYVDKNIAPSWLKPGGKGGWPSFIDDIPLHYKIGAGIVLGAIIVGNVAKLFGR